MESKNGWTAMELTEGGCRRRRWLQTWRWERRSDGGGGQNVTDKSRGRRQLGLWSFPRGVEKSNGGSSHDDLAPKRCSTTDNAVGEWVAELEARRGVTLATCRSSVGLQHAGGREEATGLLKPEADRWGPLDKFKQIQNFKLRLNLVRSKTNHPGLKKFE
jgi:IS5 family transposase